MTEFLEKIDLEKLLTRLQSFAVEPQTWIQVAILLGCILFAWLAGRIIRKRLTERPPALFEKLSARIRAHRQLSPFRLVLLPTLWLATYLYNQLGNPCALLKASTLIFTTFVLLTLPTKFIRSRFWMRLITGGLFLIAVLYILGLQDDVVDFLKARRIPLVPWDITLFKLLSGFFTLVLLLWLAGVFSRFAVTRIEKLPEVPPTLRVLIGKVAHFAIFALAIIISIQAFGIPLGALAVFGGALGLGVGFGLQKVVSNLFSGLIILLDKSVKPGDVIEIGGTYGWINSLRTRYVSVITRDNKEHLIPNEDLITQPVINWSFTNRLVRLKAPIGVAYNSDVRKVIDLCVEAAESFERVLTDPPPRCLLRGFGDNSIDLELRFWIQDPSNGTANITSEVLLAVWDRFQEHDIEIPFPQRDVHIRSGEALPVPKATR